MTSLRQKLFLSYALLVLGSLGGAVWSVRQFTTLGQSVQRIMRNNYRSVVDAQNLKETLERQDSAMQFHIAGYDQKARPQYEENRRKFARFYDDAAHNITEIGEPEAIRDIGAQFAAYSRMDQAFLAPGLKPRSVRDETRLRGLAGRPNPRRRHLSRTDPGFNLG